MNPHHKKKRTKEAVSTSPRSRAKRSASCVSSRANCPTQHNGAALTSCSAVSSATPQHTCNHIRTRIKGQSSFSLHLTDTLVHRQTTHKRMPHCMETLSSTYNIPYTCAWRVQAVCLHGWQAVGELHSRTVQGSLTLKKTHL